MCSSPEISSILLFAISSLKIIFLKTVEISEAIISNIKLLKIRKTFQTFYFPNPVCLNAEKLQVCQTFQILYLRDFVFPKVQLIQVCKNFQILDFPNLVISKF